MNKTRSPWEILLGELRAPEGFGELAVPAYSEYLPAPRIGWRPCGEGDTAVRDGDHHWAITEWEQSVELAPSLDTIAGHIVNELAKLSQGRSHQLSRSLLEGNPAWPKELAARAGTLAHERHTLLLPVALSRSQDDKGRVRWTLFGTSHLGPARAFWRDFEGDDGEQRLLDLASWALGVEGKSLGGGGLRIVPAPDRHYGDEGLPRSLAHLILDDDMPAAEARAVISFRPFAELPASVRAAYLEGRLSLLPCPASLVFFHHPGYRALSAELPRAESIPLLHVFPRSAGAAAVRVPQSGWLDETEDARQLAAEGKRVARQIRRTHRWQRVERDADDHDTLFDDPVTKALFSTDPDALGLYDKPMARNAQIWSHDYRLLLDGPNARRADLDRAAKAFAAGGRWGYRFFFPPMRVGARDVFWHLPLCARRSETGAVERRPALGGMLIAERKGHPPVELLPRLLARDPQRAAIDLYPREPGHRRLVTATQIHKLLTARRLLDAPLSPTLARSLLTIAKSETLDAWLAALPSRAGDPVRGEALATQVRTLLAPVVKPADPDAAHTFAATHTRDFEERYWRAIATLAEGNLLDKNAADVIAANAGRHGGKLGRATPAIEQRKSRAHQRDLDDVGQHLHASYQALFDKHGMRGRAVVADHRFAWRTDFDYPWSEGWRRSQAEAGGGERNIVCVIPGRDRTQAVLMGDHYDTAYMEDVYETARGGDRLRAAASGADDNHSATAALLLGADVLLPLAREGKLERDVWLVHLTGEEFPADCLGARNLAERLARRDLVLHGADGARVDLSAATVRAAFVLDMVAHNNDRDRDVFQISPGEGAAAARVAARTHEANRRWNEATKRWNADPARHAAGRGARVPDGSTVPHLARHLALEGQVRPPRDVKSSLYNTDGQVFSDAGIPVVLIMENYDINRQGYHDTHDTMANIDLDYGAAVVAIAIEAVADCAIAKEV